MKYKIFIYFLCFLIAIKTNAQQKKWYSNYWIGANVGMLMGVNKQSPVIAFNTGRTLKKYKLGVDYQLTELSNTTTVKTISLYFDKAIDGKKNQLFFYAMPNLTFVNKGKTALTEVSRFTYSTSKPRLGVQFGSGIKWKVNKHNFYLSAGYSILKYSIYAKEFPMIINPYNPSTEETIIHKYNFRYNKLQVRLGFQL